MIQPGLSKQAQMKKWFMKASGLLLAISYKECYSSPQAGHLLITSLWTSHLQLQSYASELYLAQQWTTSLATSPVPSTLGELKFNPLSVYNLHRFISTLPEDPKAYETFRTHFDAADIAYFAAGCATDVEHNIGKDRFHLMVKDMYSCKYGSFSYESCKRCDHVQALTFDMVC